MSDLETQLTALCAACHLGLESIFEILDERLLLLKHLSFFLLDTVPAETLTLDMSSCTTSYNIVKTFLI